MPEFSLNCREDLWNAMREGGARAWDVIVIGGGITGAGILREAARRGYRSLLLEQRDFCWGTSSRSSKLVHGGLRYLAAGNFKLTRHALLERERLVREAPRLVRRLSFYYPMHRGVFPPRLAAAALFWLYDRLAGVDDHDRLSGPDLQQLFPGLDTDGVTSAYRYTDAVTDDARLVLRLLHEAVADGAAVRNYSEVTGLLRHEPEGLGGKVRGVRVTDTESGASLELEAAVVINATGAWADRLGSDPPGDLRIRPQRGSHLVLDARDFPAPAAIFLYNPEDGRRLFVYPWEGRTIVGTTDILHQQGLDAPARIAPAELAYLLRAAARLYRQRAPRRGDVISTWSGVRPIIASGSAGGLAKASREHRVWSEPGLVSCSGGKLTTFHHMALDVLERAAEDLPPRRPGRQSGANAGDRIFRDTSLHPGDLPRLDEDRAASLLGRFGDAAGALVEAAHADELRVLGESRVCRAELRWSLHHEAVVHLDDLLLRRSRLGLLLPRGGEQHLDALRALCCEAAGWNENRWSFECERYREVIDTYYAVPRLPESN